MVVKLLEPASRCTVEALVLAAERGASPIRSAARSALDYLGVEFEDRPELQSFVEQRRAALALPTREQLRWSLEGSEVDGAAVSESLYTAARDAGTLLVYTERQFDEANGKLEDTVPSIRRAARCAKADKLSLEPPPPPPSFALPP